MDRREIIEQLQLKEHLNNEASNSPDASFKEDTNTLIIHKEWTPLEQTSDSQTIEPVLSEEELFQRLREQKQNVNYPSPKGNGLLLNSSPD